MDYSGPFGEGGDDGVFGFNTEAQRRGGTEGTRARGQEKKALGARREPAGEKRPEREGLGRE